MNNIELQSSPATPSGARRRAWGRGNIEQSGPDKWVVRLSHGREPATGKRVRDSRTVRGSRRDAERVLADMVRERETHGPSQSGRNGSIDPPDPTSGSGESQIARCGRNQMRLTRPHCRAALASATRAHLTSVGLL
jgi:hypothetical protein